MARIERVNEGESGGDGEEKVMKLDHVGPGGPCEAFRLYSK